MHVVLHKLKPDLRYDISHIHILELSQPCVPDIATIATEEEAGFQMRWKPHKGFYCSGPLEAEATL